MRRREFMAAAMGVPVLNAVDSLRKSRVRETRRVTGSLKHQ